MDLLRRRLILYQVIAKNHVVHLPLAEKFRFLRILRLVDQDRGLDLNWVYLLMADFGSGGPQALVERTIKILRLVARVLEERRVELFNSEAAGVRQVAASLLLVRPGIWAASVEEVPEMRTGLVSYIPF